MKINETATAIFPFTFSYDMKQIKKTLRVSFILPYFSAAFDLFSQFKFYEFSHSS